MQRSQEEQRHHNIPLDVDGEGETSQAKEPDPYKPPGEDHNEGIPGRNNISNGPIRDRGTIMGAAFPRHPTRSQSHEGNRKRTSSSLHGCFGVTNKIPVYGRGTTLPSPNEVQNASDRNV